MNYLKGCAKRAIEILAMFIFVSIVIGMFIGLIIFLDQYINNIGISSVVCFFSIIAAAYIFIPGEKIL